ncbi:MAG TPA: hypothetical protein VMM12_02010 [Longimicrobiales bacterium]|nr:hypothetical protein [Longimicrobiales bacterium]
MTIWAVGGVLAILLNAALGLGDRGLDTVRAGLGPAHTAVLLVLLVAFGYTEGVRGLQKKWVPHVIRRIVRLRGGSHPLHAVLAPLYAMGLVGSPGRGLVRAWAGVAAIVVAVLVVRAFPEPWRGIVDLAVAAALAWGTGALLVQAVRAFR